jgi:uncharacterized lipoprotein YddW (UPF0748 family)
VPSRARRPFALGALLAGGLLPGPAGAPPWPRGARTLACPLPTLVTSPPSVGATAGAPAAGADSAPAVVPPAAPLPVPPEPPREFRAAWVSPVDRGEWPSRAGMSDAEQRAELTGLLDVAARVGLNAIVLHMRPAADALYPAPDAPWSTYLVGAADAVPGYDPLAFAVAEAHRRGLQLHVWFNPFRAATPDRRGAIGARTLERTHPEWLVSYGSQTWIDPGIPAARRWVLDAVGDVVARYDVDGVHLDDYFYPYRETRTRVSYVGRRKKRRRVVTTEEIGFADGASWRRYGLAAGWEDRDDWRRGNVDVLVRSLYLETKARKPWVLVGVSPFGIWRPNAAPGVTGLDAYREIYADARRWWRAGWVDYLAPQLYWPLAGEQRRFVRLDAWWRQENVQRRHLWPGLFTARALPGGGWSEREIEAQVLQLRGARTGSDESLGHVHFRLAALRPERSALGARLAASAYAAPALPPASPWLGAAVPAAPAPAGCDAAGLRVAAGDSVRVRWWLAQWRAWNGEWRQQLRPASDTTPVPVTFSDGAPATHLAVRAVSASGVLGAPLVLPVVVDAATAR